jgi:hypothetical protein
MRLRPAASVTLAPGLGGLNTELQAPRAEEFAGKTDQALETLIAGIFALFSKD